MKKMNGDKTINWLEKIVIGLGFCPFAKAPYVNGLIRVSNFEDKNSDLDSMLDFFCDELALLELNLPEDLSTTLVVFKHSQLTFEEFNEFSSLCDNFIKNADLENVFQVVVFHPLFYFKDADINDPTNMVGRSPYPTLHILRNSEVEAASMNYPDVDQIPERNRQKILRMVSKK